MPVTCKLIGGKHRVVGPNGKVETNNAGTAVDGGGHTSRMACMKQAAAINSNLHGNSMLSLFYQGKRAMAASSRNMANAAEGTQLFKKDMLKIGVYEHPVFGWTLDITEERLHRFVAAFKSMREAGVDVEVPLDHSSSAAANLGYVVDMFVEPDEDGVLTLYGMHEIRGEEAINIIERNKNVSVLIDKDFKDGKANSYGEAIVHSSVVQQPVLPGQGDFEAVDVAASKCVAGKIPVLTLSKLTRSTDMDEKTLKFLRELLGAGDEVTAENVLSRLEGRFNETKEKMSKLDEKVVTLTGEVESLKASKSGDDKTASKIDPNLAEQMGTTGEQQLSLLVEAGKITPAVKDKLCSVLVGKSGSRNVMAMSIGDNSEPSILTSVVEALKDNDVVLLNEKTGLQVMEMSRQIPGVENTETAAKEAKETQDEMVEMAGGEGDKT